MGRVLTNNVGLQYAIESSLGVLGGSPVWFRLEPNAVNAYGAQVTTVPRAPISPNRQRRKGTITDLDSTAEFEHDFTLDPAVAFMEGFCFARSALFANGNPRIFRPTAVTSDGYTIPAITAALVEDVTLVYARGFNVEGNNGLKVVGSDGSTTLIPFDDATAETVQAGQQATVEVAGFQGASGDIEMNSDGNLVSTALDFRTLGLTVGQFIKIGGDDAETRFDTAANNGFARIVAIDENELTLDKRSGAFTTDAGTSKTIQVFTGRFVRNVPSSHADYVERSFQFEMSWPNLDNSGGATEYEYSLGNWCNQIAFNLPLTNKATFTATFVGLDTEPPTTSRKTNASTAYEPVQKDAFNTTPDVARLRITEVDESGLATDFKSVTLTINNNVTPEKIIGTLGGAYMNAGLFEVNIEAQVLFTDADVIEAIRENRTVTMDFILRNEDGGVAVDIPAMTLGGGDRELPVNQSVLVNLQGQAFEDETLGTSIGVTFFPYLPAT